MDPHKEPSRLKERATKQTWNLTLSESLADWSKAWGLTLAYAITQSTESAETVVGEAITSVALYAQADLKTGLMPGQTANTRNGALLSVGQAPSLRKSAESFAASIWELAKDRAYRGYSSEGFFRLPAVSRAAVILKTKAKFSAAQIAEALEIQPARVLEYLENAQLLFSGGKPWLGTEDTPKAHWGETSAQSFLTCYVGSDLDQESASKAYEHFLGCDPCRRGLSTFKKHFNDWTLSMPLFSIDQSLEKHLKNTITNAFKYQSGRYFTGNIEHVSPWPGVRKLLTDRMAWFVTFAILACVAIHAAYFR